MTDERAEPGPDDRRDEVDPPDGRIPIDLDGRSEPDTRGAPTDDEPAAERDDDANGYAPEPRSTPIDPETPTLEHAVFVVLGALAMIAVVLRMASFAV